MIRRRARTQKIYRITCSVTNSVGCVIMLDTLNKSAFSRTQNAQPALAHAKNRKHTSLFALLKRMFDVLRFDVPVTLRVCISHKLT